MTSPLARPRDDRPADVPTLLQRLPAEPGRPRVTWYGADGERVELSGAVLVNWVTKTTNLLVEEFDAGPGTHVLLDLPAHWRTLVWALAAWRAGACVRTPGTDAAAADVVVTDRPDEHPGAADLVVVTLPALARAYPGTLPPGAVDAAAAVMTYGDALGHVPAPDAHAPALADVPHGTLLARVPLPAPGARALRAASPDRVTAADLATALGVLGADGSLVLVSAGTAAALRDDAARHERLAGQENVTDDDLVTTTVWP